MFQTYPSITEQVMSCSYFVIGHYGWKYTCIKILNYSVKLNIQLVIIILEGGGVSLYCTGWRQTCNPPALVQEYNHKPPYLVQHITYNKHNFIKYVS